MQSVWPYSPDLTKSGMSRHSIPSTNEPTDRMVGHEKENPRSRTHPCQAVRSLDSFAINTRTGLNGSFQYPGSLGSSVTSGPITVLRRFGMAKRGTEPHTRIDPEADRRCVIPWPKR